MLFLCFVTGPYFKYSSTMTTTTPETPHHTLAAASTNAAWALIDRWGFWLLAGLMACLFFYQLGSYWLFDVDEPRYAEAAREMIERQDWITPYFNYKIRLEKPVLFYWLLIGSYKLFGVSEFSARLVSAMAATSMVAMTWVFGRYWVSNRYAFLAALIVATSLEVIGLSRMSITDMTLAATMTATTLCLFQAVHQHPRWWLAAGLFSGLAILTKGPVGLVLPGAVLTIYSVLTRQVRQTFLTPWFIAGIVTALGVAFPWYWLAYKENGQFFLDSLLSNNVSRFSGKVDFHSEPAYYYVIVLVAGFLPWTPFLPATVRNTKQLFQTTPPWKSLNTAQAVHWFAAIWAVLVFLFFTIADTKLLTYILPMFPALGLWVAAGFDQPSPSQWRWLKRSAWVLVGVAALAGLIFAINMSTLLPKEAAHLSSNLYNWLALAVLVGGLFTFATFLQKTKLPQAFLTVGLTMATLALVVVTGIIPAINQATQGAMMKYVSMVGEKPLATYEIVRPSLTYYTKRHIPHMAQGDPDDTERDKLEAFLRSGCTLTPQSTCQPVYLITKNRFLEPLKAIQPKDSSLSIVDQGQVYSLIQLQLKSLP